jgi:hypothetical protein
VHPGSRIRMLTFSHPGPGSRIQGSKSTQSRIPDPDPQHCFSGKFVDAAACIYSFLRFAHRSSHQTKGMYNIKYFQRNLKVHDISYYGCRSVSRYILFERIRYLNINFSFLNPFYFFGTFNKNGILAAFTVPM